VVSPCIRSGYCCQKAPCPFGKAEEGSTACIYLVGDTPGEYACGKYDEIGALPPEMGAHFAPAFGAGCCSPLNTQRLDLLVKR
jgi:hypothetical protein